MVRRAASPRVDPGVYSHPKTQAVARDLGIDPCKVVYHLTQMWGSVMEKRTGGMVVDLKPDVTAALSEFRAMTDYPGIVNPLVTSLKSAGFIDARKSQLWVHDWQDWQDGRAATTGDPLESVAQFLPASPDPEPSPDLPIQLRGTNYYGKFLWWVVEGFGYKTNGNPIDAGFFKKNAASVNVALAAEAFVSIARGVWGDDYDRRNLTGRHAVNKAEAFAAFKRRRHLDTVIPLTTIGTRFYPSGRSDSGGMAGGDAGPTAPRTGPSGPPPSRPGSYDLGNHPKYSGDADL